MDPKIKYLDKSSWQGNLLIEDNRYVELEKYKNIRL